METERKRGGERQRGVCVCVRVCVSVRVRERERVRESVCNSLLIVIGNGPSAQRQAFSFFTDKMSPDQPTLKRRRSLRYKHRPAHTHTHAHAHRGLAACCLPISPFLFYTVKHDSNFNQATISHLNPGSLFRLGRQVAKRHFFFLVGICFLGRCVSDADADARLKNVQ